MDKSIKCVANEFIYSNDQQNSLGRGQFGEVFIASFIDQKNPKNPIAVKVISKSNLDQIEKQKPGFKEKTIMNLKRESQIQMKIKNPYIIEMYAVHESVNNIYFFIGKNSFLLENIQIILKELCQEGDLAKYLKNNGPYLSETDSLNFFKQICEAFKILVKHNICHRDLKPENILMKNDQLKIGDFGFGKIVEGVSDHTAVGTPMYMPPEVICCEGIDPFKHDIWSSGVILYQMLCGEFPWKPKSLADLYNKITSQPLTFPEKPLRSNSVKDLLKKMLTVNKDHRISWDEIFKHELIQEKNNDQQNPLLKSAHNQLNTVNLFKNNKADLDTVKELSQLEEQNNQESRPHQNNNNDIENNIQQNQKAYQDLKIKTKEIEKIHNFTIMQVNQALFYRTIRQSFYMSLVSEELEGMDQQSAYILLNALFEKEYSKLEGLCENCFNYLMHFLKDDKLVQIYLDSQSYISFVPTITDEFKTNTKEMKVNLLSFLKDDLKNTGFNDEINAQNCEDYLQKSLLKIKETLAGVVNNAIKDDKKDVILLLVQTGFLLNKESELQDKANLSEFNRFLEQFNLMETKELVEELKKRWFK